MPTFSSLSADTNLTIVSSETSIVNLISHRTESNVSLSLFTLKSDSELHGDEKFQ